MHTPEQHRAFDLHGASLPSSVQVPRPRGSVSVLGAFSPRGVTGVEHSPPSRRFTCRPSEEPAIHPALALLVFLLGEAPAPGTAPHALGARATAKARALATAAMGQVGKTTLYDPAYARLPYPGGDVPLERGVCTDVVVRAFRVLGVDLQKELHEDMREHFEKYPRRWGLSRPDPNIDHRRVQNLETWLARRGKALPVTRDGADYWPGDLVTMDVDGRAHIALISTTLAPDGKRFDIVHNIGSGTQVEDRLFEFPLTGHFRFF